MLNKEAYRIICENVIVDYVSNGCYPWCFRSKEDNNLRMPWEWRQIEGKELPKDKPKRNSQDWDKDDYPAPKEL